MELEKEIELYFDRLFPICRSITGDGVRKSLKIIQEIIPIDIHEVPTGKEVFDWKIPKEWNISNAYICEVNGRGICDFKNNNLHIVSYSTPVNSILNYEELEHRLHYLKEMPEAIPYLTSYYKEDWGFCLSYNDFCKLDKTKKYKVVIESELRDGFMTYGDFVLKGKTEKEILFTTYICHPSMANNELSGVLITAFLYRLISTIKDRKYTYRFVFVPETVGTINYLHEHGKHFTEHLCGGLVLSCIGDAGNFTFKFARENNQVINRIVTHVLKNEKRDFSSVDFSPLGSDERQYCSPGFNLPVGVLSRSMFHNFCEYHTSLDNKNFISFPSMVETLNILHKIAEAFEMNDIYVNQNPFCEPQLGKRGLYHSIGGLRKPPEELRRLMHILNYSDGKHDLLEISEKMGDYIFNLNNSLNSLKENNLIK